MKLTKKQNEIIEFIEKMLGFKIRENIKEPTKISFITLEIENYRESQIRDINFIGLKYNKYTLADNGFKKIAIRINKEV